ncbi:hypothetical protein SDC9_176082 [bioreactor metagenome]|uniref:Uncharacterized protein n=1 Tax=bioreactor metagenome TaxID=1076179 RepID=A0A645GS31_9ZZZZ
MHGNPGHDKVKAAARLARLHHLNHEAWKNVAALTKRFRQHEALLHILIELGRSVPKALLLGLLPQDVKTPDDGDAGPQHDGKLPAKDGELLGAHLAPENGQGV